MVQLHIIINDTPYNLLQTPLPETINKLEIQYQNLMPGFQAPVPRDKTIEWMHTAIVRCTSEYVAFNNTLYKTLELLEQPVFKDRTWNS